MVGISFAAVFVRLALPAPPLVTGFYRMLLASALLGAGLAWRRDRFALSQRSGLLALASGLCFGTDLALWQTALVHTTVATATFLVNTTPIYVGLFSALVLRRRLGPGFVLGAGLALAGAAVLLGVSWEDALATRGAWLSLAGAVFYAGYLLLMTAARSEGDALPAVLLASLGATGTLGAYALLAGDPFRGFPASSWWAFAGAALVSQVGGVLSIAWALRYLPTPLASVALLGQPLGVALLGWLLLDEALAPLQTLGGVGVLAGILLASRATPPAAWPGPGPEVNPQGRRPRSEP